MSQKKERVLVAMSSGIDSSVTAALLKLQGYEVFGYYAKVSYFVPDENEEKVKKICKSLGIQLVIDELTGDYEERIFDRYLHRRLRFQDFDLMEQFNSSLLFPFFLKKQKELNIQKISTGHYACVIHDHHTDSMRILKSSFPQDDQSGYLYFLNQESLKSLILPLGNLGKEKVLRLAAELELILEEQPRRKTPQYLVERDLASSIQAKIPDSFKSPGDIETEDGRILGEHEGIFNYELGTSRNIKLKETDKTYQDYVVTGVNVARDTLTIGPRSKLDAKEILCNKANFTFSMDEVEWKKTKTVRLKDQVSFDCTLLPFAQRSLRLFFDQKISGFQSGQLLTFYTGDELIGGAFVDELVPLPPEKKETEKEGES